MEKGVPDAKKFYQTKVDFLKSNLEKLQETITAKQSQLRLVLDVIQFKFAQFEKEKALRAKDEEN
jgi:prefoldin alpha subunit